MKQVNIIEIVIGYMIGWVASVCWWQLLAIAFNNKSLLVLCIALAFIALAVVSIYIACQQLSKFY